MGLFSKKFRIPGIVNVVKFNMPLGLSNTVKLPDQKLSFHFFADLGGELSSYWNVAYRWLTDLKWNVSKWQCLPFCPPLEHANEQLPSGEVGGP